jgi:hypothetical protein
MPIEGRIHLIDRAAMILGDAPDALLNDLVIVIVHGTTLPLMPRLANANPALQVADNTAEMLEQLRLLVVDSRNELVVVGPAAAAPDARRQRREGAFLAAAQPAP